jgi:hypothetical protein
VQCVIAYAQKKKNALLYTLTFAQQRTRSFALGVSRATLALVRSVEKPVALAISAPVGSGLDSAALSPRSCADDEGLSSSEPPCAAPLSPTEKRLRKLSRLVERWLHCNATDSVRYVRCCCPAVLSHSRCGAAHLALSSLPISASPHRVSASLSVPPPASLLGIQHTEVMRILPPASLEVGSGLCCGPSTSALECARDSEWFGRVVEKVQMWIRA